MHLLWNITDFSHIIITQCSTIHSYTTPIPSNVKTALLFTNLDLLLHTIFKEQYFKEVIKIYKILMTAIITY